MNLKEELGIRGELTIVVRDKNNNIKQALHVPNLVVTAGKQYIASRIASNTATVMSHMAIGSGAATPVAGDTTLGTELGRSSLTSFSATSNTVTATANFAAGVGTGSITEAAILNASSGGTMLCRTTFPVVNKAAGDSIAISWVITIS